MSLQFFPNPIVTDTGTLANKTTTVNTYESAGTWNCRLLKTKHLSFAATTQDLKVTIFGSLDGGATFPMTAEAEFTLTAAAAPTSKTITVWYTDLRVDVKPAADDTHGTLATQYGGSSF